MSLASAWRRSRSKELTENFDHIVAGRPLMDRYELFATARAKSPLFFSRSLRAWVVTRYDDVRGVLEDAAAFAPVTEGPGMAILPGGFLAWRGREHSKKMGVVGRRVRSPRALAEDVTARVAATAKRLADDLPVGEEVDLRETYAVWIPLLVMCELTGIDDAAWLRRWYESMMATATGGRSYDDVLIAGLRAINDLKDRIGPTLAQRRRAPTGDIISDLVHTTFEDKPLRDQEIVVVAAQLFGATMETTERALTNSFRLLATDPAMYDRLRSRRGDDEALASFGAESLRLYSPIQATIRGAVTTSRVAGRRFIEGERIVAVLASANRDEGRFAAASTFDPDRFAQNPDRQYTSAGDILPFGAGEHHCVGSRLARVLIVEALRHVLDRAGGIELLEDAPDTGGLVFWSPASLRVRLRPPT